MLLETLGTGCKSDTWGSPDWLSRLGGGCWGGLDWLSRFDGDHRGPRSRLGLSWGGSWNPQVPYISKTLLNHHMIILPRID